MQFLAQAAADDNFWKAPNGSPRLWTMIAVGLILGIALIFLLMAMPARGRRPVVALVTFLSGLYFVGYYLWPAPIDKDPGEIPRNAVEGISFWFVDAMPVVASFTNILTGFLLGLGIYSLFRVHGRRLIKVQKDWFFSLVLLASMLAMVVIGYIDWASRLGPEGLAFEERVNWTRVHYLRDFMFDGLLQQMDAAMFSIIAFFILSAAYRAFRVRSIEATILLATALIFILGLMGIPDMLWTRGVINRINPDPQSFPHNFTLGTIGLWIQQNVQTPAIRGIDFGVGIGALAMGLRLWLSLEKSGTSA